MAILDLSEWRDSPLSNERKLKANRGELGEELSSQNDDKRSHGETAIAHAIDHRIEVDIGCAPGEVLTKYFQAQSGTQAYLTNPEQCPYIQACFLDRTRWLKPGYVRCLDREAGKEADEVALASAITYRDAAAHAPPREASKHGTVQRDPIADFSSRSKAAGGREGSWWRGEGERAFGARPRGQVGHAKGRVGPRSGRKGAQGARARSRAEGALSPPHSPHLSSLPGSFASAGKIGYQISPIYQLLAAARAPPRLDL
ncbi:hypothetical protein LXA43DRAFT_1070026 [Ganoderma leucocontextum]|nr:hypothetical protein LXA43DRAFT_1070026 [Ganoderma leucocontextum]